MNKLRGILKLRHLRETWSKADLNWSYIIHLKFLAHVVITLGALCNKIAVALIIRISYFFAFLCSMPYPLLQFIKCHCLSVLASSSGRYLLIRQHLHTQLIIKISENKRRFENVWLHFKVWKLTVRWWFLYCKSARIYWS